MYLIVDKITGNIWREVGEVEIDGDTIKAGFNGHLTLTYPPEVNVEAVEIDEADLADLVPLAKYKIVEGAIVENPDYVEKTIENLVIETAETTE